MATENIMMDAVKRGGDRQELHEHIRVHSMAASRTVKIEGKPNDLIERIAKDKMFGLTKEEIMSIMEPKNFIGRSKEQVEEFLEEYINPVIEKNKDILNMKSELTV